MKRTRMQKLGDILFMVEVVFFLVFHLATFGIFFNEHDNYLGRKTDKEKKSKQWKKQSHN